MSALHDAISRLESEFLAINDSCRDIRADRTLQIGDTVRESWRFVGGAEPIARSEFDAVVHRAGKFVPQVADALPGLKTRALDFSDPAGSWCCLVSELAVGYSRIDEVYLTDPQTGAETHTGSITSFVTASVLTLRQLKSRLGAVSAIKNSPDVPQTEKSESFGGGQLVFYPDRVELGGIDICSGPRSGQMRKVLEALRKKHPNGRFVAYSGEELAKKVGHEVTRDAIAGSVQRLRKRFMSVLRGAGISCGQQTVIESDRLGYHLNELISVQDGKPDDQDHVQGHRGPVSVPLGPVNDPVNGPVFADDAAGKRQAWIVNKLKQDGKLRLPEIVKGLKRSERTAKRELKALKEARLIEFVGSAKTGHYQLRQP